MIRGPSHQTISTIQGSVCESVYSMVQGTVIIAKVGISTISQIGVAIRNQRVEQKIHHVAKFDTHKIGAARCPNL